MTIFTEHFILQFSELSLFNCTKMNIFYYIITKHLIQNEISLDWINTSVIESSKLYWKFSMNKLYSWCSLEQNDHNRFRAFILIDID